MAWGGCSEFLWQNRVSRRQLLTCGAAGVLGISAADLFRWRSSCAAAVSRSSFGSARSVIFLFLHGGHPQHETFDPKPSAPAEIRGEFSDTATRIPGIRFGELLPRCASLADRLTIVRCMAHDNPNHVQACLPAMTGHKHPPQVRSRGDFPPSPSDFPHFGAVLDHLRANRGRLPSWIQLGPTMTRNNGTVLHGQSSGFLGARHSPFVVDEDLVSAGPPPRAVRPLIGIRRIKDREGLLSEFQAQRKILDGKAAEDKDTFYRRAFQLLTSEATHRAFDLQAESPQSRARYPRNQVGQSCLLARRLVEAGVPLVNVHYCKTPKGSWDTHSDNFRQMKQSLGPTLDQSLAALIEDLEQRGLLDQVLVVAMAEFGRTPKINKNAGRDHWPWVYSLALAGAGLKRGVVHGASDRLGAYPQSTPYDPADMAATIYHLLGIAADTTIYDPARRPHRLVVGKPIEALLA